MSGSEYQIGILRGIRSEIRHPGVWPWPDAVRGARSVVQRSGAGPYAVCAFGCGRFSFARYGGASHTYGSGHPICLDCAQRRAA